MPRQKIIDIVRVKYYNGTRSICIKGMLTSFYFRGHIDKYPIYSIEEFLTLFLMFFKKRLSTAVQENKQVYEYLQFVKKTL